MVLKINKKKIQEAAGEASSDDEDKAELIKELKKAHAQLIEKEKTIAHLEQANRQLTE